MKKFVAFILIVFVLAGGYMFFSNNTAFTASPAAVPARKAASAAKAETVPVREESALEAAERIDSQIWSAMRNGNTEAALAPLLKMGCDEAEERQWIEGHKDAALAMKNRHVHILAEAENLCVAEAVHYLVTWTNNGKDWNENNSWYWIYMKKANGKWEPAALSEEEYGLLNESYYKHFKAEAIEAADAGRNMTCFGNKMWIQADGVEDSVFLQNVAYMYQDPKGNTPVVIALANGTGSIKNLNRISVTVKDDKLGQVLKVSEKVSVSVLPGTVKLYEITVPAKKVRRGTWTSMHADVNTHY